MGFLVPKALMVTFVIAGFSTAHARTISHCTNGITQWSQLSSLNVPKMNLARIQQRRSITLTSTRPPRRTYKIRENRGRIFVETPSGRAYVTVCARGNNQLVATANVLGFMKSVLVEDHGGNKGVLYADDSAISFTAE